MQEEAQRRELSMGKGRTLVAVSQSAHSWPHEQGSAIQKPAGLARAGGLRAKEDDDIGCVAGT